MPRTFLTAEWRRLLMLNYAIEPARLEQWIPRGVELDYFEGRTYVSLVGFLFLDTRVAGVGIPFHRHFEEVNLRFYVRRTVNEEVRRGVVFIKEIVPKRAIAWTARTFYHERYVALPMRHELGEDRVRYEWRLGGRPQALAAGFDGEPRLPADGSEAQFIAEHYWGYAAQPDGGALEYRVEHPPWRVWEARDAEAELDAAALYGEAFVAPLAAGPTSAFVAEGSAVAVRRPTRL